MSKVGLSPGHGLQADHSGGRLDAMRAALSADLDSTVRRAARGRMLCTRFPQFPPQLPEFMIRELSAPGELVLDPMLGSGTTLVEAQRLGCRAVGCDIDPLARMIAAAKLTPIDPVTVLREGDRILAGVSDDYRRFRPRLQRDLALRFDDRTAQFWAAVHRQRRLPRL